MSATSSQYYRSADTHSHYPDFPANNSEHLYALAASWHPDPNHASYAGPPSAPLPPFLHYSNDGADSVEQPTSSAQAWPTNYSREDVQGWDHVVGDHAYTSRPGLQFDAAEGNLPAPPRPTSEASRHYHHPQTLNGGPELPTSPRGDTFRSADAVHDLRVASVCSQEFLSHTGWATNGSRSPPQPRSTHLSRIMLRDSTRFHGSHKRECA
jgi:hypothetical protein